VKVASAPAANAAAWVVIFPESLCSVTPVALFVSCVTVPPAPAVYPKALVVRFGPGGPWTP
jgi:hypothetical protein